MHSVAAVCIFVISIEVELHCLGHLILKIYVTSCPDSQSIYIVLCVASESATECSFSRVITGSIVHSATRQYLIYSEADFEVFRPAGMTRCTDGGIGPPKLKFLLRFDQNLEY